MQGKFFCNFQKKYMNILYAEDNTLNQLIVTTFLHKHNHELILANDGVEAIEKFKN